MKRNTSQKDLLPLFFEMGRCIKQEISARGYGPSHYLHIETLRYLMESGDADMRGLARYLRVTPPSATGVVDRLVRERLVVRRPDPKDRRRVVLSVTRAGDKLIEKAGKSREAAFARIIAPLSSSDRAELARILSVITKH